MYEVQAPWDYPRAPENRSVFVPDVQSAIDKVQIKPRSAQKVRPLHGPPQPPMPNQPFFGFPPPLEGCLMISQTQRT